ncbi:RDD family protein [Nocardia otitidiscaviarum]|uniref:RDD family protein n=1 Tax=Nocardia otitidiscaviarum TaxID=1823 RepID=UPI0004A6AA58|nr:RDD family protein [Nocardia otitidiscaviarum]MBF6133997.1 RDD family protein [Nocardia otitidiscaviarum]MBF6484342.1 RDD family protein [Nocardia otitidiscaviarum]
MSYPNNPYPQQPGYGQQPYPQQPQYGQSNPGYPQQPQYGQSNPGYPQQPQYGQSNPGYPQQPQYGQSNPGYPQQPAHAAPPPGYGAPQPGYPAPGAPGGYAPYGPQAPLADWGSRAGAYIVDGLIFGLPASLLYVIASVAGTESITCSTTTGRCTGGGLSGVGVMFMLLAFVVGIAGLVFLVYKEGTTGQTPGKKMLGIRLVGETTGQPIGFGTAFIRKICHAADSFACYIGWLWPLWDEKRQTFADKIMKTVVVKG